ncbi:hypothetical protein BJV82DRAFT_624887 [Fennellomyces sp. T-0311]|nr:hypothetical protein BJV82DRAFT_624887 [Fennellomyces sp. T-0311]
MRNWRPRSYMTLAGIKNLKKLWLRSILEPQPQRIMKQFIWELGKLPHLEYIYIGTYTGDVWSRVHIGDEDLRSLCVCMGLKTII